ncbi:MAG TPA: lactose ABC transporter permease [Phycisphaerales bacterium]|nr:lactose ABC transporter permease [Phycisphaerales bacterium]
MRSSGSAASAYLLLGPFLALFALFTVYPIVKSFVLSTQQTFGPGTTAFVGLDNYGAILRDPLFWRALSNTTVFTLGSVFVQLPMSLGLAMLLNRPGLRGRALYRLVFFAPSLVGLVFVAMIFSLVLEKRTGLLNRALHAAFGFPLDFPWMQQYVMAALVIAALWMYVGFNMVYFLAALQNVSRDLEEAAQIDGAGPWQRFLNVTLPAIGPVGGFVVLLSVIGSFQLFELPWIMFTGPGYDNRGLTVVMYLFQAGFEVGDLGYASAVGWILALVLIGAAVVQQFLTRGSRA